MVDGGERNLFHLNYSIINLLTNQKTRFLYAQNNLICLMISTKPSRYQAPCTCSHYFFYIVSKSISIVMNGLKFSIRVLRGDLIWLNKINVILWRSIKAGFSLEIKNDPVSCYAANVINTSPYTMSNRIMLVHFEIEGSSDFNTLNTEHSSTPWTNNWRPTQPESVCRKRTIDLITIFLIHLWLMILLHSVVNAFYDILRAARISREIIEKRESEGWMNCCGNIASLGRAILHNGLCYERLFE